MSRLNVEQMPLCARCGKPATHDWHTEKVKPYHPFEGVRGGEGENMAEVKVRPASVREWNCGNPSHHHTKQNEADSCKHDRLLNSFAQGGSGNDDDERERMLNDFAQGG
jgi:hypothetical protein